MEQNVKMVHLHPSGCNSLHLTLRFLAAFQWGSWGSWSSCANGQMTRTRKCDSSAPADAKDTCNSGGDESQSKGCSSAVVEGEEHYHKTNKILQQN